MEWMCSWTASWCTTCPSSTSPTTVSWSSSTPTSMASSVLPVSLVPSFLLPLSRLVTYPCIGGEIASTFDHPDLVKLGECKLIEEIMIGEDKMIRFAGKLSLLFILFFIHGVRYYENRNILIHRRCSCGRGLHYRVARSYISHVGRDREVFARCLVCVVTGN